MSDAPTEPRMPSAAAIVAEVIDDMLANGRRRVLRLGRDVLIDLGTAILSPSVDVKDALEVVRQDHGEDVTSQTAFYAWAAEFREDFNARRRRYRERITAAMLRAPDDGSDERASQVMKSRLIEMAAAEVAGASGLEDLSGAPMGKVLGMIESISRSEAREREVELKAADFERRLEESERRGDSAAAEAKTVRLKNDKLAAETDLLRQRHAALPARLKALQSEFDELAGRMQRGESVKAKTLAAFAEALSDLRSEAVAAADGEAAA